MFPYVSSIISRCPTVLSVWGLLDMRLKPVHTPFGAICDDGMTRQPKCTTLSAVPTCHGHGSKFPVPIKEVCQDHSMVLRFPRPKMLSELTISGGVPSCNDAMYGSTQEETNYLNGS